MAREDGTGFNYYGERGAGAKSTDPSVIDTVSGNRASQDRGSPWGAFLRSRNLQKRDRKNQQAKTRWLPAPDELERLVQNQGLLWTGFAFAGGILIYSLLPDEPSWVVLAVLCVVICFPATVRNRRSGFSKIGLLLLSAFTGLCAATFRTAAIETPRLLEPMTVALRGEVLELQHRQSGKRLLLKASAVNGRIVKPGVFVERVRLRVPVNTEVSPGDWVQLRARLFPPMGPVVPGGYDFSFRAYFQKIGATGFSYGPPKKISGQPPTLIRQVERHIDHLRKYLAQRISAVLPDGPEKSLSVALLVGDRSGIDEKTEESLRAAGLAHILAISGLHMALFAGGAYAVSLGVLALLPGFALRWPLHKVAALLALGAAVFYLLLSGASVATQRSFIMIALVFLGILTGRRGLTLRTAALAGLFLLLLAPERLFYPGFQMSFAAVIALIAVYDLWRRQQKEAGFSSKPRSLPARLGVSIAKWAAGLFVTALVAGAATGIIGAYHFSRVAPYGIVGNMLGMPVFSLVVMPMGVLALVLMPFGLSAVPLKVMSAGLGMLIDVATFTENLAPDAGRIGTLGAAPAALLMAALFVCLLAPGRIRSFSLVPLGAAITLMTLSRAPDIQIAAAGPQLAARDRQGDLRLSHVRKSFAAEIWLEGEGEGLGAIKSRKMSSVQRRCDPDGCVVLAYPPNDKSYSDPIPLKIGVSKTVQALFEDCQKADIIATDKIVPGFCQSSVILDQVIREKRGAVSIWLEPSDGSASGWSGKTALERATNQRDAIPGIKRVVYALPRLPRPWNRPGTITRASLRSKAKSSAKP
ncbi:ComEC/Rec2 family competence protein [Labrenzia sp. PHM005]|uniref:ComEC/Rec2 family competence protein n=1 Tax=Labrenzia sp. PHM005 TaxID=2590016 RepID=UPI00143DF424|nr:ComEC/Rec2 family competence protein [Labrenzia sp. PHM005]